jgi:hypothetical protein
MSYSVKSERSRGNENCFLNSGRKQYIIFVNDDAVHEVLRSTAHWWGLDEHWLGYRATEKACKGFMKAATQVLPPSYSLYHHFDETKYKKASWVVILLGGLVFWVSFVVFNSLAGMLRPDYQTVERLHFQLSMERLTALFRVLFPTLLVLVLHECIHAALLWFYTKERPSFIATLNGIGGIAVRMPCWYLSRNAFLITNLAPVCLMTLAVPFLILVVPRTTINILVFCAALNLAGSLSDIVSSVYIFSHPATTYLDTNGSLFHDQEFLSVPKWKRWLQSGVEWVLTRLESQNNNGAV